MEEVNVGKAKLGAYTKLRVAEMFISALEDKNPLPQEARPV